MDWIEALREADLTGRPFLQEQGNSVTRGFVVGLELSDSHWDLNIRDVEYLDKRSGQWKTDCDDNTYGGALGHTSVTMDAPKASLDVSQPFSIRGYGIFIYIGRTSHAPWAENDWPELDTDVLRPGPMRG